MATNPYGKQEGLPEADDYDPSVIGTAQLTAGPATQTWPDYGLELVPVHMDGTDTGRRLIRRNGDYIADVSDDYHLLPNEQAVAAANQAADNLGAVPFHDFDGDWYVELDDHVFQDTERRRVHALYAHNDPVDVTGDGDTIQFGIAVHNSIDSSLTFQVSLFTFRHACANMVFMGQNGQGMGFDDRTVIAHESRKHTKGLEVDVEGLQARIENMLVFTDDVTDTYRAWTGQFITVEHIEALIRRFPHADLPAWIQDIADTLETAAENESLDGERTELTRDERRDIIRSGMVNDTVWDTYNSLTESVWHSETTADTTKQRKMKDIHRVFPPTAGSDE